MYLLVFLITGLLLYLYRPLIYKIYPSQQIHVKISGNVKNPGIYLLIKGSLLHHLVDKAGGLLDANDKLNYNPEATLVDGQVIFLGSGKINVRK
ncbi:MAG: SLBB domain-containing protein [Leptospiraceae bacterium]|nr:SLBB domain-containing protein [Leptospiraceae bacterium]